MESLIKIFHLDWKLMLAQGVNFTLVLFVLWKWAYKPLLQTMEARTKKIEDGLANAQKFEHELALLPKEREHMIFKAKKEVEALLERARLYAKQYEEDMKEKTRTEVGRFIMEGKEELTRAKDQVLRETKAEISGLVLEVSKKVLGEMVDQEKQNALVKKVLATMKKS